MSDKSFDREPGLGDNLCSSSNSNDLNRQDFQMKDMADSELSKSDEDALKIPLSSSKRYESCENSSIEPNLTAEPFRRKMDIFINRIQLPKYTLLIIAGGFLWGNVWLLTGKSALPGGSWFALFFLSVFSWIGGEFMSILRLPPLLGMLLVGFGLRNLPTVTIAYDLDAHMSSILRNIALAVILCRAGLSLDPKKLRKLQFTFAALSLIPCIIEAIVTAIAANLILNFPWLWSFILGFVIAGVSPAVVVPSMLICQEKKLGTNKGIPTLMIAAGSLDNVVAIAAFGIVLSITFSTRSLHMTILQGPLEVIIGALFGIIIGTITWFFTIRIKKGRMILQVLILLLGSMFAIFGGRYIGYPGAGPLGSLILAFITAHGLRKRGYLNQRIPIVFNFIWLIFQPILFGLIGSEVKLDNLAGKTIGLGCAIIFLAVFVRISFTYISTMRSDFNFKEKLFVTLAWIPKATVQATIGPVALDTARQLAAGTDIIALGTEVYRFILFMAVLAILLTAPLGAILITLTAPRLLTTETEEVSSVSV